MLETNIKKTVQKILKSKKGETLIEVIAAVVVLALGIAGAATVSVMGSNLSKSTEERLIAANLAKEGLEYVRAIRETNYLRYPSNPEECWLGVPSAGDQCITIDSPATRFREGTNYFLAPLNDQSPNSEVVNFELDLDDETPDTPYQLCLDSNQRYISCADVNAETETNFYRSLTIRELNGDYDYIEVVSNVQWLERNQVKTITLTSELRNFRK